MCSPTGNTSAADYRTIGDEYGNNFIGSIFHSAAREREAQNKQKNITPAPVENKSLLQTPKSQTYSGPSTASGQSPNRVKQKTKGKGSAGARAIMAENTGTTTLLSS